MTRHAVRIPSDVVAWYYEALKNGRFHSAAPETSSKASSGNASWEEGPITVSLCSLIVDYSDWGGEIRPRQQRMALFLRQMCPAIKQGGYSINHLWIATITLPSLADCRLAFTGWEADDQLRRAWVPYRAPATDWKRRA